MFKLTMIAAFMVGACASNGTDGMNGTNGTNGSNGTNGADGTNGTNGTDGTNGSNGAPGPQLAPPGVYSVANDTAGNSISAYLRGENGNLTRDNEFGTGGTGLGSGLGSQGAIAWSSKWQRFFVVNAGNNTVSMMAIDSDGVLTSMSTVASGGTKPISVAVSGDAVYVLNYGNVANTAVGANISGFQVVGTTLTPLAGSTQPLSATTDVHPTDIVFTPDGKFVVVAERFGGSGTIDTFAVTNNVAGAGNFQASAGQQPFAFAFSPEGYLVVAEVGDGSATGSTASSYSISSTGVLTPVTSALPTQQGAACWIVAAGGYAYIANAASANITGLNVSTTGVLTLHDASGITATTGAGANDVAVSPDRGYLYSLAGGDHSIHIFSINSDGSLTTEPSLSGMPAHAVGLVAR